MELRTVDEKVTPELRKGDIVVIQWKGDIYKEKSAYLCVKNHGGMRHAKVALQNLNGMNFAFLKPNEKSIMSELHRLHEKGDLSFEHYPQDDYMMVAVKKKKEGEQ